MNRRTFVGSLAAGAAVGTIGTRGLDAFSVASPVAIQNRTAPRPDAVHLDKASAVRTLSEHRIATMEARRLRDRYPRAVGRNAKGNPAGRGGSYQIRILTTDKGARGWAMSWAPEEKVKHLLGARISDIFDPDRGTSSEADYIDLPLHDLVGHILEQPVHVLLGNAGPKRLPIYSGAVYFDDLEPPNKPRGVAGVLESCRQDYDAGYRAFKLKIGRGLKWIPGKDGMRRDIEVTRAVRERFPDCKILGDANNAYACDDFLEYVTAVSDCDLYCIEEPFQEDRQNLRKLREHMAKVDCKALIMEGESRSERAKEPWRYGDYSRRHIETLLALAEENLVDILNLDLGIVGFTRWRHIMPELVEAGVQASPHTWAWTPRPYYVAQLAAGVGNVAIIEGIPGKAKDVDYSAFKFENGNLVVPDVPGFGLTL